MVAVRSDVIKAVTGSQKALYSRIIKAIPPARHIPQTTPCTVRLFFDLVPHGTGIQINGKEGSGHEDKQQRQLYSYNILLTLDLFPGLWPGQNGFSWRLYRS